MYPKTIIIDKKYNKYKNLNRRVYGTTFQSRKESDRYLVLRSMKNEGKITNLEMQLPFILQDAFIDNQGRRHRPITYLVDFYYLDKNGLRCAEDVKGIRTKEYVIKKKLFIKQNPDIFFQEI